MIVLYKTSVKFQSALWSTCKFQTYVVFCILLNEHAFQRIDLVEVIRAQICRKVILHVRRCLEHQLSSGQYDLIFSSLYRWPVWVSGSSISGSTADFIYFVSSRWTGQNWDGNKAEFIFRMSISEEFIWIQFWTTLFRFQLRTSILIYGRTKFRTSCWKATEHQIELPLWIPTRLFVRNSSDRICFGADTPKHIGQIIPFGRAP